MNRRQAVLTALRDAGGRGVSGEVLANALGVSRTAIAKHVVALRHLGYEIRAVPGSGYALAAVPDLALPEEVAPLLGTAFWVDLEGGGETGSTNDDAKALARAGASEGTVVLAAAQTGGRGRFARAWASPPGGVYLSAVLRPPLPLADTAPLPLALALGVARGLEGLGVGVGLKWPNDVVLPGGWSDGGVAEGVFPESDAAGDITRDITFSQPPKLAGVLVEVSAEADALEWAVVGIGINVRRPPDAAILTAAYVEDLLGPRTPPLARVAASVLDGVAGAYLAFLASGFPALADEYAARSVLGGREVTVRDRDGGVAAQGVATGVDAYGRLVVEGPAGRTTVSAGDVTLRAGT